jgi:SecY interacting protein Syd
MHNTLSNFFKRFINSVAAETGQLPLIEYDTDSPSYCQQGDIIVSQGLSHSIHWQPVKRSPNTDFSDLEQALEIKIHTDLHLFFTSYWSEQIDAIFQAGNLSLMFVCNNADMARLIENQIGHILNKQRNKQALTFFIACTDTDYVISVDNETGQVMLERSGHAIENILAPNLDSFLDQLEYGRLF